MTIKGRRARPGTLLTGALLAIAAGCAGAGSHAPESLTPERVQIGYGTADRRDVTTAVSSMTEKDLDEGRAMRLVDLLASRVPGVRVVTRPDGDLSVRIRGASDSLSGEPLIVVDGMPVFSNRMMAVLETLNTHDIQRIDVLKDAGSTAIYGVRGGNGVILVTTRRGR